MRNDLILISLTINNARSKTKKAASQLTIRCCYQEEGTKMMKWTELRGCLWQVIFTKDLRANVWKQGANRATCLLARAENKAHKRLVFPHYHLITWTRSWLINSRKILTIIYSPRKTEKERYLWLPSTGRCKREAILSQALFAKSINHRFNRRELIQALLTILQTEDLRLLLGLWVGNEQIFYPHLRILMNRSKSS